MKNPYPGPRAFSTGEYQIFAGRDFEISELTSLIISHPTVLLFAPSGTGKSSLVNAGIAHSLDQKNVQFLSVPRLGTPIPRTVALNDILNVYSFSVIGHLLPASQLCKPDKRWWQRASLADALARIRRPTNGFGEPALRTLVLDQFEDLFLNSDQRWRDREPFFDQLSAALQADDLLRILFVLREDYLASFDELARAMPDGVRARFHLERLRAPEAVQAVVRPLEGTNWKFAPGVAEELVNKMMMTTLQDTRGTTVNIPGEDVELVQLQVVCYRLIESMPPGRPEITMDELQTFGDPDKVLQSVYEQALTSALEKTPSVDERDLRLWFDKHLVTPAGTRGMVFQDREKTGGIPNAVVEALAAAHIVRPEFRAGSRWYELAHDRFIRPIQTSNQDWYPKHPEKSNRGITDWERNVTPLHDFWVYLPEFLGRRESPVERDVVETMAWNISKKATNYMYIVETEENLNKLLDLVLELERHPAFAETSDRETVRQKIRVLMLSGGEQGVGKAVTGLLHLGNCWIANPNGVRGKKAQGYEVAWDETGRNPIGGRILPGPKMDRIISNIKKIVDAFPPPNFVGVTSASMESLMKKSPSIQVKCARD